MEAVIEGKEGAPAFVTVPFIIYGICAEFVVGLGYLVIGYKLPIKNTVLRGFAYIMLILISSYIPNILAMLGGDGKIIEESLSMGILVVDVIAYGIAYVFMIIICVLVYRKISDAFYMER